MGIHKYEENDLFTGIIQIGRYHRIKDLDTGSREFAVRIDTSVTPIFCAACNKQVPGFYKLVAQDMVRLEGYNASDVIR
ncbi:hypothetical protein WMZ97_06160 [Lentibacillus sp. N15]|uniref:hypothetical protein n=1 Tax=Lentibacillus songyuanensis TaxID=3136161 RepID=UPI0031BB7349